MRLGYHYNLYICRSGKTANENVLNSNEDNNLLAKTWAKQKKKKEKILNKEKQSSM